MLIWRPLRFLVPNSLPHLERASWPAIPPLEGHPSTRLPPEEHRTVFVVPGMLSQRIRTVCVMTSLPLFVLWESRFLPLPWDGLRALSLCYTVHSNSPFHFSRCSAMARESMPSNCWGENLRALDSWWAQSSADSDYYLPGCLLCVKP